MALDPGNDGVPIGTSHLTKNAEFEVVRRLTSPLQ